ETPQAAGVGIFRGVDPRRRAARVHPRRGLVVAREWPLRRGDLRGAGPAAGLDVVAHATAVHRRGDRGSDCGAGTAAGVGQGRHAGAAAAGTRGNGEGGEVGACGEAKEQGAM
ncbi:MAG: hypothetical protein AVDCRST_MAG18-1922, partial [uncultured Thermomicrobiales bacterium]